MGKGKQNVRFQPVKFMTASLDMLLTEWHIDKLITFRRDNYRRYLRLKMPLNPNYPSIHPSIHPSM